MRKEEILRLRDRVLPGIIDGLAKKHIPMPEPDARLYPQEVDGELFWIDRLSYPGVWPHAGHGAAPSPAPGLRYEVWYFQKRETVLLTLLCDAHPALEPLVRALEPVFTAFEKDGKYAKRYRSVRDRSPEAALLLRVEPNSRGVWRAAPVSEEKLVKALEIFITDTYSPVQKAVQSADPDGRLPGALSQAAVERDPLAELKAKFNADKR